jgi:hypothetical protein
MARTPYAVGLFTVLLFAAAGCKPKPGGRCSIGAKACLDGHTSLICVDSKYTEAPCAGPDGCLQTGRQVDCDDTIASKGDSCDEPEDLACSADKKSELRCRSNHFVVASSCRGPTGCFFTGNKLHCDTDLADLSDPCEDKDDLACSLDKKALYKCDGAKYDTESTCRGPKGCVIEGTSVKCDHHVAEVGDACHTESAYACTSDRKTLLICRQNKFKKDKGCNKPCSFTDKGDSTEFDCP